MESEFPFGIYKNLNHYNLLTCLKMKTVALLQAITV